jgi:ammonium transporter, Amt family
MHTLTIRRPHVRSLARTATTAAGIGGLIWPAWALAAPALTAPGLVPMTDINAADTAWVMVSTALVLLMTLPGIALFYGGMVRSKNVINTMASVVAIAALVSVLWFAVGYSLAFTPGSTTWGGFGSLLGGLGRAGWQGLDFLSGSGQIAVNHMAPHIPESVYAMFQLAFAIITCALVVGSLVERMRFTALMCFIGLWSLVVYAPIAHWVWESGGWLAKMGALDFAGGSVVHINAGAAGLVVAYALGPRTGYGREAFSPFNLGLTMVGTGLLWVGWFGFNAGSALAADGRAGMALAVTHLAAATGALAWMGMEAWARGRVSLLGMCSGAVAGLVAITPASGYVGLRSAVLIGLVAGVVCYWGATGLKRMLQADDSHDVFGVHGLGGLVGALLTGVLADPDIAGVQGNLGVQALTSLSVLAYSLVGTALVLWITSRITPLRATRDEEQLGLDMALHSERLGH